jgi:hypothetical protein
MSTSFTMSFYYQLIWRRTRIINSKRSVRYESLRDGISPSPTHLDKLGTYLVVSESRTTQDGGGVRGFNSLSPIITLRSLLALRLQKA